MKKAISLLLALILVLSLTACDGHDAPANDANTENTQPDGIQQPSEPEDTSRPDTQPEASYSRLPSLPTTTRAARSKPPMKKPPRRFCVSTRAPLKP